MSFGNLLKISYWFSITTPPLTRSSFIAALVIFGVLFTAGVALRIKARKARTDAPLFRGLTRLSRPFFFLSLAGFLLVWFRELGAAILSARFWTGLIFVITVVWFVLVLRSFLRTYSIESARLAQERKYKEYLPQRKGKK